MSVLDIQFLTASEVTVYDHITVQNDLAATTVKIRNLGEDTLKDLGVHLTVPSSLGGNVDNPPDYTPASAYQTVLDWGQDTSLGNTAVGGLKMTHKGAVDGTDKTTYFTRSEGSSYKNRIRIGYDQGTGVYSELPSGGTITLTLIVESPPGITAKRLFVNIEVG